MMRAIDVMVRDVVTVHPGTDVAAAIKLLAAHDVSALPVQTAGWSGCSARPTCSTASKGCPEWRASRTR
jgi:hypothetical protein